MKTCSRCSNERRGPTYRYCKSCHAEYSRLHRKPLVGEARKRMNARSYLHIYIKRGKIVKGCCKICGSEKVEAHHENYDKPLDVIWLCRQHHIDLTCGRLSSDALR